MTFANQALPTRRFNWQQWVYTAGVGAQQTIDWSSGFTAYVDVVTDAGALALHKTTGITLAATAPNYVVAFTPTEMATLAALITGRTQAVFTLRCYTVRTADGYLDCYSDKNPPTMTITTVAT